MTTCGETGFGYKKTKRNRISVLRSANSFPVYRLQHYIKVTKEISRYNRQSKNFSNNHGFDHCKSVFLVTFVWGVVSTVRIPILK